MSCFSSFTTPPSTTARTGPSPSTAQEVSTTTGRYPMPYFAAPGRLPEPLPTDAIIKCSSDVLKAGYGRRIVRVGQHFVVKYGVLVSLTEGENMLFVRETCDISVPQVFALYSRIHPGGTKVSYIVMEYIQGKSLDNFWDTMSAADKSNTSQQLRLMLDKLRSVPSPGYFGCIGRRPMEEGIFWTRQEDSKDHGLISGPFDTEAQLNNALVEKYLYNSGCLPRPGFTVVSCPASFVTMRRYFLTGTCSERMCFLETTATCAWLTGSQRAGIQATGSTPRPCLTVGTGVTIGTNTSPAF
ncbi:phosphotransferase enzyme family protein [Metarhizium robertsii ARSEF 23]|uniref:Phosphotransferase enzyme family protein n=1 Tax=Metarhizium robertsii (strain ARSEF 23 / ATCC MYA-3075) TaxID=655844 RepID=E9FCL9_METRA|nr:phosphotransferase enzyme family protein [Metarhizium robertsii ARSEF 23]EFY94526.1 phosphotransferase enzyme family protein [Metarhizium robertsii ARSEF 23]